jgi:putative ABC transport system permease protein
VYRQLNYIQTKKIGFSKDQVLIVNGTGALQSQTSAFKEEIQKIPGVKGAAFAGYLPVQGSSRNDNSYSKDAVMDPGNLLNMQVWQADYDYVPLMGMEFLKGRNFSKAFGSDSSAIIINETAARILGYSDPIGKKMYTFFQDQIGSSLVSYEIIGVVKDFHFESLRQNIGPLALRLGKADWVTAFKINTANVKGLLASVESKWKEMAPGMPFNYQFLDEAFDNMYRVEQRTGKLGLSLAIIAIVIACLGLLGLAIYTAEQRIKEIGIRKVLGASVGNLVVMLSKDFLRLVLIASIIAIPLAWWGMNKWLQTFAFRISVSWWILLLAAAIACIIAFLTISVQSIRAATSSPVKNLRSE